MSRILLEICVDDAAGIRAAEAGGADRIELCAALALGGLTPSAGLIALAAKSRLPAMAMIRPRAGDFVWSREEVEAQKVEIAAMRQAGLAGVVIGASTPDGGLHAGVLAELVEAAAGIEITLHRAIDLAPDPIPALRICQNLGIKRVLSSGGATSALKGLANLRQMMTAAPGMIIMPGGGISAENVSNMAEKLDLSEVHASCSSPVNPPQLAAVAEFGFQPVGARATDPHKVAALRAKLDQIAAAPPAGCTQSR